MLKFEPIDQGNIEVFVIQPNDQIIEDDSRFLGEFIKNLNEYEFFTTPTEYFHALWWIDDGDLESLKQKLLELNTTD